MTPEIMEWCRSTITAADVEDRDVLEVGSSDYNGSVRPHVESLGPRSYVGVDMEEGGRVDELLLAEELVERFGEGAFDLVLSTEMLEHAEHWQEAFWNMMAVTKPGGVLVVTTRGPGFPFHPCPVDCWRFTTGDFAAMLAGWEVDDLRDDPGNPGVFARARRPRDWNPAADRVRLAALSVHAQRQG